MTRRRRSYWPFHLAAVIAYAGIFAIPAFWQMHVRDEDVLESYYAGIDSISRSEATTMLDAFEARSKYPSDDPEAYFKALREMRILERRLRKMSRGDDFERFFTMGLMRASAIVEGSMREYQRKHSQRVMAETAQRVVRNGEDAYVALEPRAPSADLWLRLYKAAMPFALFSFLLRLDAAGFSVLIEIFSVWRLALATVLWPIGIFKYPNGDPARQLVQGLRFAAFFLGTAVSGFAGSAKAEITKESGGRKDKRRADYSLQLDARTGRLVGETTGLDLDKFFRATIVAPSGALFETVTAGKQSGSPWANTTIIGYPIWKPRGFTMNGVTGLRFTSRGEKSFVGGLQFLGGTERFGTATAAFRIEREVVPKSQTTFVVNSMNFVKAGKLRIGGEVDLRKPFASPSSWYAGPFVGVSLRKSLLEIGAFRNQEGDWRARLRVVQGFSFSRLSSGVSPPATNSPAPTPNFTTSVSASYSSRYVGELFGIEIFSHAVLRQDVFTTHRSGIYADAWNSMSPRGGMNSDFGDETDIMLGASRSFRGGSVLVDGGCTYLNLKDLTTRRGDLYDAYLVISGAGHPLRPYARLDWAIPRNPEVFSGGVNWKFGIKPTGRHTLFGRDVAMDITIAGHDGALGFKPERVSFGRASFSVPLSIKQFSLAPSAALQKTFGDAGGIAKDKFWLGLTFGRSFNW